jgi:nucleotidyltransferase substrate binding protein (TIGR01987 family)
MMSKFQIEEAFLRVEKALKALNVALLKPIDADDLYLDATIQRFEFSIELFWKLLKLLLASKGVDVVYPKDVLRESFAGKLIDDEQMWLAMLRDRNLTSHTYNEELAITIYANIKKYYPLMATTVKHLKTVS